MIHPSGTLILLCEKKDLRCLLLKRSSRISFGGHWAFPGGIVEKEDIPANQSAFTMEAAKNASIRETKEECSLDIENDVIPYSYWETPPNYKKRFGAWYFLTPLESDSQPITMQKSEVDDYQWVTPAEALSQFERQKIQLPPPTYITLIQLARYPSFDALRAKFSKTKEIARFKPTQYKYEEGIVTVHKDDIAYTSGNLEQSGARHRLWMPHSGKWRYEKNDG